MSGHSKWATTKHHKAAQDAARSKLFMKLAKEISVASKNGTNPDFNSKLKLSIAKAKANSMPAKNIQNAIDLGSKPRSGEDFSEIVYEGFLSHGVSVIVECLTDSNNRTASNIKSIFRRAEGTIGKANSVTFFFNHVGILQIPKTKTEDEIMDVAIDYLTEIIEVEDSFVLKMEFQNFHALKEIIEGLGIVNFITAEIQWEPREYAKLTKEQTIKAIDVIKRFEDDDDVQNVYHNIDESLLDE